MYQFNAKIGEININFFLRDSNQQHLKLVYYRSAQLINLCASEQLRYENIISQIIELIKNDTINATRSIKYSHLNDHYHHPLQFHDMEKQSNFESTLIYNRDDFLISISKIAISIMFPDLWKGSHTGIASIDSITNETQIEDLKDASLLKLVTRIESCLDWYHLFTITKTAMQNFGYLGKIKKILQIYKNLLSEKLDQCNQLKLLNEDIYGFIDSDNLMTRAKFFIEDMHRGRFWRGSNYYNALIVNFEWFTIFPTDNSTILINSFCGSEEPPDWQTELLSKDKSFIDIQEKYGGFSALMNACRKNYSKSAQLLIKNNANVNLRTKRDSTALMFACIHEASKTITALINAKADVNVRNRRGYTALMYAVPNEGGEEEVKLLCNAKADINATNNDGDNALFIGIKRANVTFIKALLNRNADVDVINAKGQTLFEASFETRNQDLIHLFIDTVDTFSRYELKQAIKLSLACSNNFQNHSKPSRPLPNITFAFSSPTFLHDIIHIKKYKLNSKANQNLNYVGFEFALMLSFPNLLKYFKNNEEKKINEQEKENKVLESTNLVVEDASIMLNSYKMVTCSLDWIHLFSTNKTLYSSTFSNFKKLQIIPSLKNILKLHKAHLESLNQQLGGSLSKNDSFWIYNNDGHHPLLIHCHIPAIGLLTQTKAYLDNVNVNHQILRLWLGQFWPFYERARTIGIDFSIPLAHDNSTWLINSLYSQNPPFKGLIQAMIEGGTPLNAQERIFGNTALIQACSRCFTDIAVLLIENKADVNLKNKRNDTALMEACYAPEFQRGVDGGNRKYLVTKLIEAKAELDVQNCYGLSALGWASQQGHSEEVKLLIQAKANPNVVGIKGKTPLLQAVICKKCLAVKLLLEARASVNCEDKTTGKTLQTLAKESGDQAIIKMIDEATQQQNNLALIE